MARNFNTLRKKMPAEAQALAHKLAEDDKRAMALDELREAQHMTQEHLARLLKVSQGAISQMERRTDMYVSTLQDFVRAMGGELRIIAYFPSGQVTISQFLREPPKPARPKARPKKDAEEPELVSVRR